MIYLSVDFYKTFSIVNCHFKLFYQQETTLFELSEEPDKNLIYYSQ